MPGAGLKLSRQSWETSRTQTLPLKTPRFPLWQSSAHPNAHRGEEGMGVRPSVVPQLSAKGRPCRQSSGSRGQ